MPTEGKAGGEAWRTENSREGKVRSPKGGGWGRGRIGDRGGTRKSVVGVSGGDCVWEGERPGEKMKIGG